MSAGFSILVPHYSTPLCDASLDLCVRMLRENTENRNYELIIVHGFSDPYIFWNTYADHARFEQIAFLNNDMLPAPGWDVLMQAHTDDESLVMGYLVESGVIPVAAQNIHQNFGRSPASFEREAFERFCAAYPAPELKEELGWYMPVMMTKTFFFRMGKYPTSPPFPHPNDVAFWDRSRAKGTRLKRVRSFAYHFQGLSQSKYDRIRG